MSSVAPHLRYDVAVLYLEQTDYDLDAAIQTYKEDERWEKEHPHASSSKGKAKDRKTKKRGVAGGISGQL